MTWATASPWTARGAHTSRAYTRIDGLPDAEPLPDGPTRHRCFRDEALALRERASCTRPTWAAARWTGLQHRRGRLGERIRHGRTDSTDFPTQNPFQMDPDQSAHDAFVTKLSPSGNSLVYSTYLGGNFDDFGHRHRRGRLGERIRHWLYRIRQTSRPRTPSRWTNPATDAFVTKLSPSGNSLVYSTYLGGNFDDLGGTASPWTARGAHTSLALPTSTDFPTQNPFQTDQPASMLS